MTEIALIGNPNSGKTSLFNLITGNNQRVGNWPGVTVERMEGAIQDHDMTIHLVDLSGNLFIDILYDGGTSIQTVYFK